MKHTIAIAALEDQITIRSARKQEAISAYNNSNSPMERSELDRKIQELGNQIDEFWEAIYKLQSK